MAEDVGETDIEERKDLFLTVPLKQLQFGFSKVLTPHVIRSQVTGGDSNGSNMDMSTVYKKAVGKCPVVNFSVTTFAPKENLFYLLAVG